MRAVALAVRRSSRNIWGMIAGDLHMPAESVKLRGVANASIPFPRSFSSMDSDYSASASNVKIEGLEEEIELCHASKEVIEKEEGEVSKPQLSQFDVKGAVSYQAPKKICIIGGGVSAGLLIIKLHAIYNDPKLNPQGIVLRVVVIEKEPDFLWVGPAFGGAREDNLLNTHASDIKGFQEWYKDKYSAMEWNNLVRDGKMPRVRVGEFLKENVQEVLSAAGGNLTVEVIFDKVEGVEADFEVDQRGISKVFTSSGGVVEADIYFDAVGQYTKLGRKHYLGEGSRAVYLKEFKAYPFRHGNSEATLGVKGYDSLLILGDGPSAVEAVRTLHDKVERIMLVTGGASQFLKELRGYRNVSFIDRVEFEKATKLGVDGGVEILGVGVQGPIFVSAMVKATGMVYDPRNSYYRNVTGRPSTDGIRAPNNLVTIGSLLGPDYLLATIESDLARLSQSIASGKLLKTKRGRGDEFAVRRKFGQIPLPLVSDNFLERRYVACRAACASNVAQILFGGNLQVPDVLVSYKEDGDVGIMYENMEEGGLTRGLEQVQHEMGKAGNTIFTVSNSGGTEIAHPMKSIPVKQRIITKIIVRMLGIPDLMGYMKRHTLLKTLPMHSVRKHLIMDDDTIGDDDFVVIPMITALEEALTSKRKENLVEEAVKMAFESTPSAFDLDEKGGHQVLTKEQSARRANIRIAVYKRVTQGEIVTLVSSLFDQMERDVPWSYKLEARDNREAFTSRLQTANAALMMIRLRKFMADFGGYKLLEIIEHMREAGHIELDESEMEEIGCLVNVKGENVNPYYKESYEILAEKLFVLIHKSFVSRGTHEMMGVESNWDSMRSSMKDGESFGEVADIIADYVARVGVLNRQCAVKGDILGRGYDLDKDSVER